MISPTNRSHIEYLQTVRHALRTGSVVPHPRHRREWAMLWFYSREIFAHFADCGVAW